MSEAHEPTVAVVVPVRNGATTIDTCLEALCAVDWPRERVELVVVDNGSTDGTAARVRRHPVRLLHEHSRPSSYLARNRGVAATRAEILAFTDADCVPDRGWIRALAAPLADPGVGGVAGAIEAWRAESAVERWQARRALLAGRAFRHPVLPFAQTANAAYRRDAFVAAGGFDPDLVFGGDLDFSWRLQRCTGRRLAWAPDAIVRHRHRTTWSGLYRLYEKNAIANCLLALRHEHYVDYPGLRTGAWLAREVARSALRAALGGRRGDGAAASLAEAVRYAGELGGWLRWHCGVLPAGVRRVPAEVRA